MNPEQWKRVEELFERAAKLPEGQWAGFLVAEAGDDLELIDTVLKMLRSRDAEKFIEPPTGSGEAQKIPSGQAWVGRTLGDFELKEPIGHGGMGLVFRARQVSLNREVAVKILPFESMVRAKHLERFEKESRAAARLHHPHIVPIHSVGQEGDVHWFAMELVDGPDLAREIKRLSGKKAEAKPRLPPYESREYVTAVVRLIEQAADALAYAHANGVIHRDIKPHNLLIDPDGQLRIVDFGLARDDEQGTITSSEDQIGSPYYMSPEQVRRRMHAVDARTDIYSLGVVLYELLSLRRPFDGASSAEVWYRIVHDEPPKLRSVAPRVPVDLAIICATAMARELKDRYVSAQAFRDDLRRFLNHESILARAPSLWRLARRFVRHHTVACGSAATAVLAVTAGFGVADWRNRRHEQSAEAAELRRLLDTTDWDAHLDQVVSGRRLWLDLHTRADSLPAELRALEQELGRRFDDDFEARRARLEEHLRIGLGGMHEEGRWGGYAAPSSAEEIGFFQLEGERLRTIYSDRSDVAPLCELARASPRVTLHLDETTAAEVHGAKARATLRRIDPLLGTRGPPQDLGELPRSGITMPPGNWRFDVEIPGFGFAEYTRYLLPRKDELDIAVRVRRSDTVTADMKAIEAGTYEFDREKRPKACDIAGPSAEFEAFWIDEAEVSNRDFVRFLTETGHPLDPDGFWEEMGYKNDWHQLMNGTLDESFLDLPVAGISWRDAQAYAEWAGKRIPTHVELERALRGADGRIFPDREPSLPPAAANYNVYGQDSSQPIHDDDRFKQYLVSVRPVRDPRYRQPPEGLFHAFGNVAEMSESLLAEPEEGTLATKIFERVYFGGSWDAGTNNDSLQFHATTGVSGRYSRMTIGLRCCKSRTP